MRADQDRYPARSAIAAASSTVVVVPPTGCGIPMASSARAIGAPVLGQVDRFDARAHDRDAVAGGAAREVIAVLAANCTSTPATCSPVHVQGAVQVSGSKVQAI